MLSCLRVVTITFSWGLQTLFWNCKLNLLRSISKNTTRYDICDGLTIQSVLISSTATHSGLLLKWGPKSKKVLWTRVKLGVFLTCAIRELKICILTLSFFNIIKQNRIFHFWEGKKELNHFTEIKFRNNQRWSFWRIPRLWWT